MPFDEVMGKFAKGRLHSGSSGGPVVKDRSQAVAIMLSEKRKSKKNPEYRSKGSLDKAMGKVGSY